MYTVRAHTREGGVEQENTIVGDERGKGEKGREEGVLKPLPISRHSSTKWYSTVVAYIAVSQLYMSKTKYKF